MGESDNRLALSLLKAALYLADLIDVPFDGGTDAVKSTGHVGAGAAVGKDRDRFVREPVERIGVEP